MSEDFALVWLKRDLRITDHAPINNAIEENKNVAFLYVIEPEYWKQPFSSRRHWFFVHDCLKELEISIEKMGMKLLIRVGEMSDVLDNLAVQLKLTAIYCHQETGGSWTFKRDRKVQSWCKANKLIYFEFPSNGVVRGLKNRDDWSKIRNARMKENKLIKPKTYYGSKPNIKFGNVPSKDDAIFGDQLLGVVQTGGRVEAIKILNRFLFSRGKDYLFNISKPGVSETTCSRLSAHLTWGTISVREVLKAIQDSKNQRSLEKKQTLGRNLVSISSRLSWRCHFIQKLEDQPTIEFACMHQDYEMIRENEHDQNRYLAWKNGMTGYPLIDACMRSLIFQGWITFRMRALLVSFASYDLWLDWRKTGNHLAKVFTDYEPGIHYSQLQMQSGVTGINAVRIYNPIKQSIEHDPNGTFIRKWVPELRNVSNIWIHEPWKMPLEEQAKRKIIINSDYPSPIVDHQIAIKEAKEKLSRVRKKMVSKKLP